MDIVKDVSEAIGVVPLLKPIFASVAGLLRAVQVSIRIRHIRRICVAMLLYSHSGLIDDLPP